MLDTPRYTTAKPSTTACMHQPAQGLWLPPISAAFIHLPFLYRNFNIRTGLRCGRTAVIRSVRPFRNAEAHGNSVARDDPIACRLRHRRDCSNGGRGIDRPGPTRVTTCDGSFQNSERVVQALNVWMRLRRWGNDAGGDHISSPARGLKSPVCDAPARLGCQASYYFLACQSSKRLQKPG
jgi:hypothetical protein